MGRNPGVIFFASACDDDDEKMKNNILSTKNDRDDFG
jgi:hypothetical protein